MKFRGKVKMPFVGRNNLYYYIPLLRCFDFILFNVYVLCRQAASARARGGEAADAFVL